MTTWGRERVEGLRSKVSDGASVPGTGPMGTPMATGAAGEERIGNSASLKTEWSFLILHRWVGRWAAGGW